MQTDGLTVLDSETPAKWFIQVKSCHSLRLKRRTARREPAHCDRSSPSTTTNKAGPGQQQPIASWPSKPSCKPQGVLPMYGGDCCGMTCSWLCHGCSSLHPTYTVDTAPVVLTQIRQPVHMAIDGHQQAATLHVLMHSVYPVPGHFLPACFTASCSASSLPSCPCHNSSGALHAATRHSTALR